jgi:8-oxo-dGTP pyrophosphatase MutT (NUDIX family)
VSKPLDASLKKGAPVEKVTVFVMNRRVGIAELLLLYHPHAGIQLPAGTVETGESAMAAALREAQEETGLHNLVWGGMLGVEREELPLDKGVVALTTPVYTRADLTSYSMATLRHGYLVDVVRAAGDFLQVHYAENDRYPDPQYTTFELLGWVPANTITGVRIRHFAWLAAPDTASDSAPSSWTNFEDFHNFTLRWHPLDALPELVPPQAPWLRYLPAQSQ